MANIKFKSGSQNNIPVLGVGEPGFCTDTKKFFIGDGSQNIEFGGTVSTTTTLTRTTPTIEDNYIEIGYIPGASVMAAVTISGDGNNTIGSKRFLLCSYSGTTTGWAEVLPILNSGVSNSNDFTLDANWDNSNTKLELRIRLSNYAAVISGSLKVFVEIYSGQTLTQTASTGSTTAPATYYDSSIITQYNDKVGIGTDNPSELLDVNGIIQCERIKTTLDLADATLPSVSMEGISTDYVGSDVKVHFQASASRAFQLSSNLAGNDLKFRFGTSTAWDAWKEIIHTGNMSTECDADTLDGLNSLQFIRNDQDEITNGNLTISKSSPSLILNNNSTTTSAGIKLNTGSSQRWEIASDGEDETGSNVGSDLAISRYNDSGVLQDTPFKIDRASGDVEINKLNIDNAIFNKIEKIVASVDVKAICIHDVIDDDDPDWINKCGDTSYYNEPLNTSTRGKTRKPPARVLITGESDKVTIYDLTDPDVPMWMVLLGNSYGRLMGKGPIKRVKMINGCLFVGKDGIYNCVTAVNFVVDSAFGYAPNSSYYSSGATYCGYYNCGIINRNVAGLFSGALSTSPILVNGSVNDLAVTRLPNAPINPATNMRYPTPAVATDGGISIIDGPAGVGTVKNMTCSQSGYEPAHIVGFRADGAFVYDFDGGTSSRKIRVQHTLPLTDLVVTAHNYSKENSDEFYHISGGDLSLIPTITISNYATMGSDYIGSTKGLHFFYPNPSNPSAGAIAYITNNYNTGVMRGDIQACLMADTESGSVGGELVTNGDGTSLANWSYYTTLEGFSIDAGTFKLTQDADGYCYLYQVVPVTIGKTYCVSVDLKNGTAPRARLYVDNNTPSGTTYGYMDETGTSSFTTHKLTFTPVSSTLYLSMSAGSTVAGVTAWFDNISVTEAVSDRCVQGNHAQVVGSLTKSAVATGAELMAYSFFHNTRHVKIPYTPDFDFDTGNFCFNCWVNLPASSSSYATIFSREPVDITGACFHCCVRASDGYPLLNMTDDGWSSNDGITIERNIIDSKWHKLVFLRDGATFYGYLDGILLTTTPVSSVAGSLSNASAILTLGVRANISYSMTSGSISLFQASATAPTPEQIKADYLAELPMFQENAKCTLSGSSNDIKASTFDKSTNSANIFTNVRDTFNGLINIDQGTFSGTAQCAASCYGALAVGTSTQATIIQPAKNLREEIAKSSIRQKQFGFVPRQMRFSGDASNKDFTLASGWEPWAVYGTDGTLKMEGASDDYVVKNIGLNTFKVSFASSPSADDFIIMAIPFVGSN